MDLKENLEAAEDAVTYIKKLEIRASNKVSDRLAAQGGVENLTAQVRDYDAKNPNKPFPHGKLWAPTAINVLQKTRTSAAFEEKMVDLDVRLDLVKAEDAQLVKMRARWAATLGSKAGNCQEQAIGALLHLFDQFKTVRPLHLMKFSAQGYDHVWVGVGLANTWNKADKKGRHNLREWGQHAVWCDPWQGDGVAFAIADFIKGKVRNLDAIFKCNTPELVEEGVPISIVKFD